MPERRALLFDFGGTLDADGVPWGPRFHAAYRAAGGDLDLGRFDAVFRESDRIVEATGAAFGLGFRAMIALQAEVIGELLPAGDPVSTAEMAEVFHHNACLVAQRNALMLERLLRRYSLGVVSNYAGNLRECLAELGL